MLDAPRTSIGCLLVLGLPLVVVLGCTSAGPDTAGDSGGGSEPLVPNPFALGEVQACDSPLDGVVYAEVGAEVGLAGTNPGASHTEGGFSALDDFDGDGDLDLFVSYAWEGGPAWLYRREGEVFAQESVEVDAGGWVPSLVDIDGDGDRDILLGGTGAVYLAGGPTLERSVLPLTAGSTLPSRAIREFAPGDFDGDGRMDLYVACTGPDTGSPDAADFLLWAQPDGTFLPDTETIPSSLGAGLAFDALAIDLDGNGWVDSYVDNDKGGPNLALYNDQGALADASDTCLCAIAHSGMGVDAADVNRDGFPDLYLAGTESNALVLSDGTGTWYDATLSAGASPLVNIGTVIAMTWGAVWLDFDNSGELDLLITQGDLWGELFPDKEERVADMPINLLRGSGGGFEDVAVEHGLDQAGSFRAAIAHDLNGDGVLDLLVTEVEDRPQLYMSQGCTASGWLEVEAPPGARVEVTAGGITQTDWVMTDSAWGASQPPVVHFGLGAAQQVDALRVVLLGGEELYTNTPFAARRRVGMPE